MSEKLCENCINRKTMNCPNSSECMNTKDKPFYSEEEKKIPEKLNLDTDKLRGKETPRAIDYLIESKINQVIDYLKSKGK